MSFEPSWLTRSSWFRFLRTAAASRVSEPAVIQADLKVRLYEYGPGAYRSAHLRSRLWYTAVNWTAAG